ncbi:hypothetical protein B0H10DRAFT_2029231 [Mycena sp. CBHHK59/15]|nr:hypothetical protein B0H10DRAFT_2029231 [Mycena sp. CBHHK59/15]
MGKGQFNEAQNQHIQSFFPEFVQELDKGLSGTPLTRWKQTKASTIIETPAFATLDLEKISRKGWFEMIVRKFTNYRNQVYLKSTEGSLSTLSVKKGNPLLKFASLPTGRQLFAQESHDSITSAARDRALATGEKNPAALYQQILKNRWDALSVEDQSAWKDRAEGDASDVAKNQTEFATNISLALEDLCKGQMLGAAEMVLFYAFRDPDNGDLLAGTVHGHCLVNQTNFGGSKQELQLNYRKPWSEVAEHVLPRVAVSNPVIPRNSSNQPVLPAINLNAVPVTDIRVLLAEYFDQCWAARGLGTKDISIPWDEIVLDPGKYYDTEAGYFAAKLDHPQNLGALEVLNLAQQLLSTSVMESPTPFHFLQTKEVILIPSTPRQSTPPPVNTPLPVTPLAPETSTPPAKTKTPADKPNGKRKRAAVDADGTNYCRL